MKKGIRILAIDDSPFRRGRDVRTFLVGLLFRELTLELSFKELVTVDGDDSTEAVIKMVEHPKVREEAKLILTHGTTFAGLNLLDMHKLYERTEVPVVAITSREPTNEIEKALRSANLDYKIEVLRRNPPYMSLKTPRGTCYFSAVGMSGDEVSRLLIRFAVESKIPEQLRIVDVVARLLEGLAP